MPSNAPHTSAYIGLGANLGDSSAVILAATRAIGTLPRTRLVASSSLYRSAPIDARGPDFINAVAHIQTQLAPLELLAALQALETASGRVRPFRNAPRTLDLDILLYGDLVSSALVLTLPHPRMHERRFVLCPLAELAPQLELPGLGSLQHWLARVAGQAVERVST